jgi:hypothetical protein
MEISFRAEESLGQGLYLGSLLMSGFFSGRRTMGTISGMKTMGTRMVLRRSRYAVTMNAVAMRKTHRKNRRSRQLKPVMFC